MTRNRGKAMTGNGADPPAPGPAAVPPSPTAHQPPAAPRRSGRAKPAKVPKAEGLAPPPEQAGPAVPPPIEPAPAGELGRLADLALRIVGVLVGMAGGLITAVIEAFLTPLRIGSARVPVSILLAVVGNVLLVWFTYRATSHRGAAVLPGLVWFAIMIIAAGRTSEGDLLLTGDNWVGVATIFAGTIGFAGAVYRLILPRGPSI
jgi:hypothetical protein